MWKLGREWSSTVVVRRGALLIFPDIILIIQLQKAQSPLIFNTQNNKLSERIIIHDENFSHFSALFSPLNGLERKLPRMETRRKLHTSPDRSQLWNATSPAFLSVPYNSKNGASLCSAKHV